MKGRIRVTDHPGPHEQQKHERQRKRSVMVKRQHSCVAGTCVGICARAVASLTTTATQQLSELTRREEGPLSCCSSSTLHVLHVGSRCQFVEGASANAGGHKGMLARCSVFSLFCTCSRLNATPPSSKPLWNREKQQNKCCVNSFLCHELGIK